MNLLLLQLEIICNQKLSKQIARENIKTIDEKLNKTVAKKLNILHYFTNKLLQVGIVFTLDSHPFNCANSFLNITANFLKIETRYFSKMLTGITFIYARLKNQIEYKHQTVFSAKSDNPEAD